MSDPRSVVVTGSSSGIGLSIARTLAEQGWSVVGVDRTPPPDGGVAEALTVDVTADGSLDAAATRAESIAPLRGWVNCAAIIPEPASPLHASTALSVREVLDVNLLAVIDGTRVAISHLLAHGRSGSIVNISSVHARFAFAGWSSYAIAKAGVEALTRAAAVEYGGHDIRVNAVAPGLVAVPRWYAEMATLTEDQARERERAALVRYPLKRLAQPAEAAAVVAFLLDAASSYVTGAVIPVDGGLSTTGE